MSKTNLAFLAIFGLIITSFSLSATGSEKSAKKITRKIFEVKNFTGLEVSGKLQIEIKVGEKLSVAVIAEEEVFEKLEVVVKNKVLRVGQKPGSGWSWSWKNRKTVLLITVPKLNNIELSGASKLVATGIFSDRFTLEASGAVEADLEGKAKFFSIAVSGAAEIRAYELDAQNVEIDVSGAGEIEVFAHKTIKAEVSGAATVKYKGTPAAVKTDISGMGTISPRG